MTIAVRQPDAAASISCNAAPGNAWDQTYGTPLPLGCTWIADQQAFNFALYSKHATAVTLLLYREDQPAAAVREIALDPLHHKTGRVWHCRLSEAELQQARLYAYRVDGPAPEGRFAWHAFDRTKILFDPYARALHFPPQFDRFASAIPGQDTAGRAPLGVIMKDTPYTWANTPPTRHGSDAVIYEINVRGFTAHPSSGVAADQRGTFAGLKAKIPYLKDLGVTVVELMPVHQWDPQEGSVWGYMPINFFALHHQLAASQTPEGAVQEFRELVDAFHAAGIEVILDVVYNHTGEGDAVNYCYKGIDNSTYYLINPEDQLPHTPYANFAGTGNAIHAANHAVRKLILDSLRYWVEAFHVDGFRFDLASVFSRNTDGSLNLDAPAIFSEISCDPVLSRVRLIAEPWDAVGGYQLGAYALGRSFPGTTWQQWNDRYRMEGRRFLKGDEGLVGSLMGRVYGSADLFPDDTFNALRPWQSINYLHSHDGFSLYDWTAYNAKTNPHDGSSDNQSWNHGWEGDTNVPAEVVALRRRQARNAFTLLMLSAGTPMFRAGDEFLHTQGGHNNPYNVDALNWLDWDRLAQQQDTYAFARSVIALRKRHPGIARHAFWREDVTWFGPNGGVDMTHPSHTLAWHLRGSDGGSGELFVMINAYWEPLTFQVQAPGPWRCAVDTLEGTAAATLAEATPVAGRDVVVGPRSIVVLERPPT